MARLKLRQDTVDEVIDLLLPLMATEADRRGLLFWAFANNKTVLENLNYGGDAREFVDYLVGYLCAYGEVEPGVQALWMLMVTARDQVGDAAKARIDALFPLLQQTSKPSLRDASLDQLYGQDDEAEEKVVRREAKNLFDDDTKQAEISPAAGEDVVTASDRQLSLSETRKSASADATGSGSTATDRKGPAGQPISRSEPSQSKPTLSQQAAQPETARPGGVAGPKDAEPSPVPPEENRGERLSQKELEAVYGPSGGAMQPEPEVPAPVTPTDDVRFTAYFPRNVAIEKWYTLLVYTYVQQAFDRVRADSAKFKHELGLLPRESHSAPARLARGTELVITPTCDGVVFNPERVTVRWLEDLHRADFRFRAGKDMAGVASNGLISISVGPVIIATIKMAFLFEEAEAAETQPPATQEVTAAIYKQDKIFLSYSHTDTGIVVACRNAYKSLGFSPLIDIDELRSGENWSDELMRMIDRADIFQLFWSARSSQSKYVQQEWEYALKKSAPTKGEGFIRPVYWEKPLTTPPDALGHLHFAFVVLPKLDET